MPEINQFKGEVWPRKVAKKLLGKPFCSNSVADFPSSDDFQDLCFSTEEFVSSNIRPSGDQQKVTRKYKLFASTWNVAGIPPSDNLDLEDWLDTRDNSYDIYVLGFQEVVPLNAKNVLGPENNTISMKWNSLIKTTLNKHSNSFHSIISKQMVGIMVSVWVRNDLLPSIRHPSVSFVGCGIMGFLGNKGSVSLSFLLHETSFCIVCCHLASGGKEGDEINRNSNAMEIFSRTRFSSGPSLDLPRKIYDHERIILLGDLNYRISLPDEETRSLVLQKEWDILLKKDQLRGEIMEGRTFGGWNEGDINFSPTYKYYLNSDEYYGIVQGRKGEKKRAPAWCDRILSYGTGLNQTGYDRCESKHSDHRPVRATFNVEVEFLKRSNSS
ncbi:Type I inositol 1,4,5-trisphosphate 5-phosphatase CVP2 [Dendrobium catenatum]|uniref:Type I inositol 1,4,5-trisphosphate 5-phosphatase CVP2 n=1 Tax=Dendrobium catenatum TaxID=906689 RepID=A0A2I0WU85_9ASPA|nr:Type I inositol 1,4,5-trisphosphate 5-phosphatase CVP2 [Dendrobium catenatum]